MRAKAHRRHICWGGVGKIGAARAGVRAAGRSGRGEDGFSQGMAAGLGVGGPVSSPTFTILQVYEDGRLPFYHFDAYRISDVEEMEEIGYEDCFYGEGVCLVEWADLIAEILPPGTIVVKIEKDLAMENFDFRLITVDEGMGDV